jgi:hypothetical protein
MAKVKLRRMKQKELQTLYPGERRTTLVNAREDALAQLMGNIRSSADEPRGRTADYQSKV